jgi:hypothetical protein
MGAILNSNELIVNHGGQIRLPAGFPGGAHQRDESGSFWKLTGAYASDALPGPVGGGQKRGVRGVERRTFVSISTTWICEHKIRLSARGGPGGRVREPRYRGSLP